MFLQVSVYPQGGCLPHCMLGYTPPQAGTPQAGKPPWAGTPPGRYTPMARYIPGQTPQHILPSGGSRIFQMGGRCFVANGGAHILFSGKKCMKLKEIGLKWGGARLLAPCYSKITIFL